LMKQKQYSPLSVAEMAISLFAVNEGYLDEVPADKVVDYEGALHAFARTNAKPLIDKINAAGNYDDAVAAELKALLDSFKTTGTY